MRLFLKRWCTSTWFDLDHMIYYWAVPFPYNITQNGKRNAIAQIWLRAHFSSVEFESDVHSDDDAKAKEKDIALHSALSELSSEFSRESMLSMNHFYSLRRVPVISTGLLKLDLALGIGGLPKGRFVEIFGQEASGKSTLALHIIKEAQKHGGYCVYIDAENAMTGSLLQSVGVDLESLLIVNADSGEKLLSIVHTLIESNSVDVIVVDTVAALVPQCELDKQIGDMDADNQSLMMTRALQKINQSLYLSGTVIIFLNQLRTNQKGVEYTCGGNALGFYAAIRMGMVRKQLLKRNNKISGFRVCVQVVKNKMSQVIRNADLELRFGEGFCCD